MSSKQLRAELLSALQTLVQGDLRISATALLATLGYASNKTLDLPVEPKPLPMKSKNCWAAASNSTPPTPTRLTGKALPSCSSSPTMSYLPWPQGK